MKIGIYGGTFDPIHNGHLEFARRSTVEAHLDKVVIVAEKNPYRKRPHASWDHRQAMIERATEDFEEVEHDYSFANKLSHQHTMRDMLLQAERHYGSENQFWFLVGSDTFEHMHKWQDVAHRGLYGGFVVALRADYTEQWLAEKITQLKKIDRGISYKIVTNMYKAASSSSIRMALHNKVEPHDTPQSVVQYLRQHHIYTE